MEVGQAATYVDLSGKTRDCLIARIREDGKANIVVVNTDGGQDDFGRLRAELDGIPVGEKLGCVCDLDSFDPDAKKPKKKKKVTKKKAS